MKIGVIGAGTMGAGIAQVFAQKGYEVVINAYNKEELDRGIASIDKQLQRGLDRGRLTKEEKDSAMSKIKPALELNEFKDCNIVIEAATENVSIKTQIFKDLDEICGSDCILATNTSSLSITQIAAATNRPDKVIGMHFFNPVPVMKLVEVINGIATSEETFKKVFELASNLGKEAVKVEEAPGFVVNRILIPMINEAIGIYADKVASVEDIDKSMMLGANHPIGPLALGDLVGLDVCLAIMDVLYNEYQDPKYRAHTLLRKMVRGGKLGRKTKLGFYDYRK